MRLAFRLAGLFAVLFAAAHAAPVPKDPRPPAKIDLDRLEGTWRVTSMQLAGNDLLGDRELLITFKKGEFSWAAAGGSSGKIATIDPTKTPREVDYTFRDGAYAGKVLKAIYRFDGDTFTDCFDVSGTDRPKEFASTRENGLYLITYKRVKKDD